MPEAPKEPKAQEEDRLPEGVQDLGSSAAVAAAVDDGILGPDRPTVPTDRQRTVEALTVDFSCVLFPPPYVFAGFSTVYNSLYQKFRSRTFTPVRRTPEKLI